MATFKYDREILKYIKYVYALYLKHYTTDINSSKFSSSKKKNILSLMYSKLSMELSFFLVLIFFKTVETCIIKWKLCFLHN